MAANELGASAGPRSAGLGHRLTQARPVPALCAALVEAVELAFAGARTDAALATAYARFLAPVLRKLGSADPAVRTRVCCDNDVPGGRGRGPQLVYVYVSSDRGRPWQVVGLVTMLKTLVRSRPAVPLPLESLLALYASPDVAPSVRAFTILFVESALLQAPPEVIARPSHDAWEKNRMLT
jgi:hypothetical protein